MLLIYIGILIKQLALFGKNNKNKFLSINAENTTPNRATILNKSESQQG